MNELAKRKSIRLPNYDYSRSGLYYVTICTQDRICLFGNIVDGKMQLNEIGKMVNECWRKIPERFEKGFIPARNGDRATTNEYIRGVKNNGWPRFHKRLWQRNYYEYIIRDEQSLSRICKYIMDNPKNWENDRDYVSI